MTNAPPLSLVIDGSIYLGRRSRLRGLGVYTRELVRGLVELAPDLPAVITDPVRGREVPAAPAPDIEPVESKLLEWDRRPGHWIYEAYQTRYYWSRRARPGEVVLFTCHDALPWWLPRASVVVVHDLIASCYEPLARTRKLAWLRDGLAGWQAGQAARIGTDSESTRQDVLRLWGHPPERVQVTGNVFSPPDDLSEEPSPRLAGLLSDPRPYLVFVGAREERKGLRELLAAWEARSERDVRLLIVAPSGGVDAEIEARVARLRPRDDFLELIGVTDDERNLAVSRAVCLLFPSRYEGFGRPLAEAMQLGTPVLTFENSSLVEVCGGGGVLFPDGDFDALLAESFRLARDSAAREAAAALARARAPAFDWRVATRRFLDVLEEVSKECWAGTKRGGRDV